MAVPLALTFAGLALATVAYAVYEGVTCGASVSADAMRGARCVSYVHPFLPAYGLAALACFAAVWRDRPALPLLAGVVGAAFGTLAGFSLGAWGVAVSLMLVGCGISLRPRHPVAWGALAAAVLPFPALILLASIGPRAILGAWLVALAPGVLWLALGAWWMGKAKGAK